MEPSLNASLSKAQKAFIVSGCIFIEFLQHNVDETDARLISVDDRICNFALCFQLLEAALYCRYPVSERGAIFQWAACRFRVSGLRDSGGSVEAGFVARARPFAVA
jgi:hypothetical protein